MLRAELLAIEYFSKWVMDKGGSLRDTSRDGVGYDFLVEWPDETQEKFEVKGTKKILKIPDMSVNEFDDKKQLKADYIFVVGNVYKKGNEVCYKIPRSAMKPENLRLKQTYHIRKFQNKTYMDKYREEG